MNDLKYFCYGLVLLVIVILVSAGLYAAWPTFTHTATVLVAELTDIASFFLSLLKILAVLATLSLTAATVILLYRFYLDTQVIRPGRWGAAQAIRWRGEIYELSLPAKTRKQREVIETSFEIASVDEEIPQLPAPIPTFTDLLNQGIIAPGSPLVIGVREDSTLRIGTWLDLYTLAVAGVAGTGKSTSVLFYLLQAVLRGARLVMIDPHAEGKPDSLAKRLQGLPASCFIGKIAITDQEILSRVRWTANELKRRQKTGKGQPIILVVDEFTRLMRTKEIAQELGELLEAIAQEGRGYNIFALLTGQIWTATRTGGTELRYSIASSLVHRIQEQQAALLIPRKYAKLTPELQTGQALLYDTNGQSEILSIPLTTISDVAEVATLLAPIQAQNYTTRKSPSNGFPPSFQAPSRNGTVEHVEAAQEGKFSPPEVTTEGLPDDSAGLTEVHPFDNHELEIVASHIAEAKSPHEIVGLIWSLTGGREYQEKKLLVQQMTAYLVREAMPNSRSSTLRLRPEGQAQKDSVGV